MEEQKALWGWHPATNTWIPLQVAANGSLVIDPTALFENPPTEDETEKGASSEWSFDHDADPIAHQDTGGRTGVTSLLMTENIILVPRVDTIHQILTTGGVLRAVTLNTDDALAGDRFVIRHNDAYNTDIEIRVFQGAGVIERLWALSKKSFLFDGTDWIGIDPATAEGVFSGLNVALGQSARADSRGFALGGDTDAHGWGVSVGYLALSAILGVAIGFQSVGNNYGLAFGAYANTQGLRYSIAFGYDSTCTRVGETTVSISGGAPLEGNYVQGRFSIVTEDDTPVEMFPGNYTPNRFTIKVESALAFQIKVVAKDEVDNHVAMYTFEGLIKRDAVGNTVMSVCNKTVIHEDDAAWDCDVTANDVQEAILITVTGDDTNPTKWAAVLEGVEVIFPIT